MNNTQNLQDKSRSRFLPFQGKRISENFGLEEALFYEGDAPGALLEDGTASSTESLEDLLSALCIVRMKDGLIANHVDDEGGLLPAVEADDGHTEWWEEGKLHRTDGPAVLSEGGLWEEYWEEGRLLRIESGEETPDAETSNETESQTGKFAQ
jgi:hypothetical protein